jgi:hypothetical protein
MTMARVRVRLRSAKGSRCQRVSEYDIIHRPDIVEFAADFPGTGRDSKWAVAYMKAKRVIPLPGSRTK